MSWPSRRLIGSVFCVVVAAGGVAVLASPAEATAANSTITCPATSGGTAAGSTVTSGSCGTPVTGTSGAGTVAVRGNISYSACGGLLQPKCAIVTLSVQPPGGGTALTSSYTETTGATSGSATVTVPAGAANGTYQASLAGDSAAASASFVLQVPPSAPTGEAVDTSTPAQATVTWSPSSPTPADSYALQVDGQATTLTPDCSSGTCTATVTGLAAGAHTFTVVAQRADGAGGALTSSTSAHGTVTAAPVPSSSAPAPGSSTSPAPGGSTGPSPGPAGSGGSGGSTGTVAGGAQPGTHGKTGSTGSTGSTSSSSSTSGAAKTVQEIAAAAKAAQQTSSGFHAFAPPAGIALLPPLPQLAAGSGSDPNGEPTAPGTYAPTLPYSGVLTVPEKVTRTTTLGHIQNVVSDRGVLESLSAAALVLLVAAHLRAFVRRSIAADL